MCIKRCVRFWQLSGDGFVESFFIQKKFVVITFHQLEPEQKLIQLLDTMKAIGYA